MKNKSVIVLIAVIALSGVLLDGCGALDGDTESDTIADYEQPIQESPPLLNQYVVPGEVPDGLTSGDWAGIQEQIAAVRYRAYKHPNDGFVSSNPAHGWQIHFGVDGTTTLGPRDNEASAYHLSLKLSAIGFTKLQSLDSPKQITADAFSVTYQWNAYLREWWVNSAIGLEQWFEFKQRPPGTKNGQPLKIEMTLATDLAVSQHGDELNFVNAAGTTVSYNKLSVWDANGRELPANIRLLANQLYLIIDDTEASYPLTIDPSFQQQAYLKASNTGADDGFGFSVAVSGDTLVVGAPNEASNANGINGNQSDNSVNQAGAAYVFTRSGTMWRQEAYIKASNTGAADWFGYSVAISGNTLVVGAPKEASNATGINGDQSDNSANYAGAAYVFTRSGTEWSQQAYLKASNTDAYDEFGYSVAVSGDTLVVGAYGEDSDATGIDGDQNDHSADRAGAAYVFARSGTVWGQQAYLKASNTESRDRFGKSVAISGDTIVVGAHAEASNARGINGDQSDNSAVGAGAAYVFIRDGTTWSQQAYLKASNTHSTAQFGFSAAISGDTVVIGAVSTGAAYVFMRNGMTWSQRGFLNASNADTGDGFGFSVAISGDTVVVGAVSEASSATGINGDESDNSTIHAGAAYVFARSGTIWSQQAYLKASNTGAEDDFGLSVAISGNTLVIGAIGEASNATGVDGDQNNNSAADSGAAFVLHMSGIQDFTINAGHSGAWYNPDTAGQGQLIDVEPESKFLFLSWFTFTDGDSSSPDQQHWFTAQGNYSDDTADLTVYETLGGRFDDPQAVTTEPVGTATLSFSDCGNGQLDYAIDTWDLQGSFPLLRAIPGTENVCEERSGNATESLLANDGRDGAWFDENAPGQGFLIDAHPNPDGDDFIFVAWFTYGEGTSSGQRWLTAQGPLQGTTADITVYETLGGRFDDPQSSETNAVGSMTIDFTDCSNAVLSYSIDDESLSGMIDIKRAIPGTEALCQELSGVN